MRKVNYKSDFDFKMKLKDCEGKDMPFPDCDWEARFYTAIKTNAYVASHRDGVFVNCRREEDGSVRFVFDSHRLGPGTLKQELHLALLGGIILGGGGAFGIKAAICVAVVWLGRKFRK